MFITAHIAAGLIAGALTHNYVAALIGALFIDLDHLIVYIKNKVIFDAKKFWKTVTDPNDPYGDQRHFLHSFITWSIISIVLLVSKVPWGFAFSIGYLSHLLLDLIDGSDFRPFFPFRYNVKGPIKYYSQSEFLFTVALLIIFMLVM